MTFSVFMSIKVSISLICIPHASLYLPPRISLGEERLPRACARRGVLLRKWTLESLFILFCGFQRRSPKPFRTTWCWAWRFERRPYRFVRCIRVQSVAIGYGVSCGLRIRVAGVCCQTLALFPISKTYNTQAI